ncbi:metal-sensitive transcriptional regulator [Jannaschia rubra]|nr:metal-sensitive transcriptional regulator [Jannaschia rubra]
MDQADKADRREAKVHRLNRIAGQVQGVARMVAEGRYCMDILNQVQAVKAALAKAEAEILRDHAATCVHEAIRAGDAQATQMKLDELVGLFDRSRR